MSFVGKFEPKSLWKHCDKILTIPRGSKEEAAMREYVIGVAAASGLAHDTDAAGNVVVRKSATPGRESAPTIILQGHLDMVNEKDSDVTHDFNKDAIKPRQDGEYLNATGTTLGSDNGIGVAAMLALLEAKSVVHGPLEFLFTIDEETGLTGAAQVDAALLHGRSLINLDSEEEYTLTVGCAGGADNTLRLPISLEPAVGSALRVRLRGLRGGHSGIDIHLQRGNAVKLLARMLNAASAQAAFRLAGIEGGNKHNAIPREASAVLLTAQAGALRKALQTEFDAIKSEFAVADPDMQVEFEEAKAAKAWSEAATARTIRVLEALPHGVLAMSMDIKGLVETSTNVATVAVHGDMLVIGTSSRSSVMPALRAVQRRIRAIGELAGAEVAVGNGYPGWKPNMKSALLQTVSAVHKQTQGRDAEIVAVHAGLECGIIGEKIPGMDMISFGPQIEFPHSPNERVQIASVARFFTLLTTTLETLAKT